MMRPSKSKSRLSSVSSAYKLSNPGTDIRRLANTESTFRGPSFGGPLGIRCTRTTGILLEGMHIAIRHEVLQDLAEQAQVVHKLQVRASLALQTLLTKLSDKALDVHVRCTQLA